MLVYGDHKDVVSPRAALKRIAADIQSVTSMPTGFARHSALVSLFVETGRVLQGVADADFSEFGEDRRTEATDALGRFAYQLASAVHGSWTSDGLQPSLLPTVPHLIGLPAQIEMKVPEGHAFYALYPEAFAEAALKVKLRAPPFVIGLRSIGTSLAAMVAAALKAPAAVTVRPVGDPFDRHLAVSKDLAALLLSAERHFVIVDEGPGLSGSSFGAVADWLESHGVPRTHLAFVCSHGGAPGAQALDRHVKRWGEVQRVVGDFGQRLAQFVGQWSRNFIGPLERAPLEISGGGWRPLQAAAESQWPAVNPMWERRKYLLRSGGETFVARFAGLGREGANKLAIARALHAKKLVPEPLGLAHGFLIERWHEDAIPIGPVARPIEQLATYLAARAHLPVPRSGASIAELFTMMKRNVGLALGGEGERRLAELRTRLDELQSTVLPVCSDGRLDRHEWLRLPDGRLLKTDGVDHHAGHDLVGCQDVAWDVAAAAVEFDLDEIERRTLVHATARAAQRAIDPKLLEFLTLAYLTFRLGQACMSADMTNGEESQRWRTRTRRYRALLSARLAPPPPQRPLAETGSSTARNEPAREQS